MKIARIEAEFPELPDSQLSSYGEGSTIRAAISRAVAELFSQPQLKSKRIRTVTMTVNLATKTVTEESVETAQVAQVAG